MEVLHGVDDSWSNKEKQDLVDPQGMNKYYPGKQNSQNTDGNRVIAAQSQGITGKIDDRLATSPSQNPSSLEQSTGTTHEQGTGLSTNNYTSSKSGTEAFDANISTETRPRPLLTPRSSTEHLNTVQDNAKAGPRRGSWLTTLSSKFSSISQSSPTSSAKSPTNDNNPRKAQGEPITNASVNRGTTESSPLEPYIPQKPKESSGNFFSSLTRRLNPNTAPSNNAIKGALNGGVCPRRTLNVNMHRVRCDIPELEPSKLRRVAFSVDVEVAGPPKYRDEEDKKSKKSKKELEKDKKLKERSEGDTLKHVEAAEDVNRVGTNTVEVVEIAENAVNAKTGILSKKQEKKKRSEEERKERKEKKRRKAEENGTLPVERNGSLDGHSPNTNIEPNEGGRHDRPTTDPVRIYRRCCQLRESPILKRITEQLSSRDLSLEEADNVTCLDLRGSRLQLADFITLGDWLAVVPVRQLLLDDVDIADEGLRVVLAGLLTTKKNAEDRIYGVIENLTLSLNPRITPIGWRYISLFLHMSRSIKTLDLAQLKFPVDYPVLESESAKSASVSTTTMSRPPNVSDVFVRAIHERPGGAVLEEIVMTECDASAEQVRKILEAAKSCGIARVSFAGSHLDDASLDHIYDFVRSGICTTVDLGNNDLRGNTQKLADALADSPDCSVRGLSLASCNLDASSLQTLLPAILKLRQFRFLDISHNKAIFSDNNNDGLSTLRHLVSQIPTLRRLHLTDVGLSAKQAISLAEVLAEGSQLAHVNLLNNEPLISLIASKDEADQQETCALFASLMSAVRASHSIICVDIDAPPTDSSDVVKALARQILLYCLRNLENVPVQSDNAVTTSEIKKLRKKSHGDTNTYTDVLSHFIGPQNDVTRDGDGYSSTADGDYIVSGNGVIKALQYCLEDNSINAPGVVGGGKKAREMTKNLLGSARTIRARLQTALAKESAAGNVHASRRLVFLEETLQKIISRFELEYPECRLSTAGLLGRNGSLALSAASADSFNSSDHNVTGIRADLQPIEGSISSDEEGHISPTRPSNRSSQVSLASRVLSIEEGRMHKLGLSIADDRRESLTDSMAMPIQPRMSDASVSAPSSTSDSTVSSVTNSRHASDANVQDMNKATISSID